jgi:Cof subfamily protein (haloacid dehalogenase superfamily)
MRIPALRIRLVVTDIDGTLVTPDKELTPRVLAVVERLRSANIKLALVSSRPARGMDMFLAPLGIDTPRAGFNGGEILAPDGRMLESLMIPESAARLSVEMMETHGVDAWVFADGNWYLTDPAGPYVPLERRTVGIEPKVIPNWDSVIGRAGKIMGSTNDYHLLERLETQMISALGSSVAAHRSQDYYLDVTHPDAHKGAAMRALARLLDVPIEETAALGDMPNDISMLATAGLSVAMGNAPDEVQESAMFVTGTNTHDGWAEAIETYILPRASGTN